MSNQKYITDREDKIIRRCKSWDDFVIQASSLKTTKEKGDLFERLTQLYLQTRHEYSTKLKNTWLLKEVPTRIHKRLNLPLTDEGIDLIAETHDGQFWSIQCKFKTKENDNLTRRDLVTFTDLSFNHCENINFGLVFHTSDKPVRKRQLLGNISEVGLENWLTLTWDDWRAIHGMLAGKVTKPKKRVPRSHQKEALSDALKHFKVNDEKRGRLIMPCGSGKSLIAFFIAEALKAKTIVVAVPSLNLIRQSLDDWTREFAARDIKPDWLCVCSDDSVGNLDYDQFMSDTYETGIPTTTDTKEIKSFILKRKINPKIIFVTYQSSNRLADAARSAKANFDLAILDEAHKTTGKKGRPFATLLFEKNIKIKRRLAMTATERVYRGDQNDINSMDDPRVYGSLIHTLSFAKAVAKGIISDYQILTITITNAEIRSLISSNKVLTDGEFEADAQSLSAAIALRRAFKKYKTRHAVSFHQSIARSKNFCDLHNSLNKIKGINPKTENFQISSKDSAGRRQRLLKDFETEKRAIISNARCLTEGVDVPAIDCVLFADPKQSVIDIVQAAGRAMRPYPGKSLGYIIIPIIVPDKTELEDFAKTTEFKQVTRIVAALSTQDERIAEEFREIHSTKKNKRLEIVGDIPETLNVDPSEFSKEIKTQLWKVIGRANFISYSEAKVLMSSHGIESETHFREFVKSENYPPNVPKAPAAYYKNQGWISWADFLGNPDNEKKQFHTFSKAREISRKFGVDTIGKWRDKAAQDPLMPFNPDKAYANDGWESWSDFLNASIVPTKDRVYLKFEKCRALMVKLGVRTKNEFDRRKGEFPPSVPKAPHWTYRDKGFRNFPHFFGQRDTDFLSYAEAKTIVEKLGLASVRDYEKMSKSKKLPPRLPSSPQSYYKNEGWISWLDFLGKITFLSYEECQKNIAPLKLSSLARYKELIDIGTLDEKLYPRTPSKVYKSEWEGAKAFLGSHSRYKWRNFFDSRAWVRKQNIVDQKQWKEFVKTSDFPSDIPKSPWITYKNKGWVGIRDWLGTGTVAPRLRQYRPFKEARTFARSLNLKSGTEWSAFSKSGKLPADIPSNPNRTYKDKGWKGFGDWLGTGTVASRLRVYRPFKEARTFARSLNLKSSREWEAFTRSGKLPDDIPAYPNQTYKDKGWIGMGDWLGTS